MGLSLGSLFWAVVVGFLLALCYDTVVLLRYTVIGKAKHPWVWDTLFLWQSSIVTYLLALTVDFGRVRFFLLAGEGIGAALYFFTIGAVTKHLAVGLHRVFLWLLAPWRRFAAILWRCLVKICHRGKCFLEKMAKKRKNPLKRGKRLVYNQTVDVWQRNGVAQDAKKGKGGSHHGKKRAKSRARTADEGAGRQ
jgi:hypothetical protein